MLLLAPERIQKTSCHGTRRVSLTTLLQPRVDPKIDPNLYRAQPYAESKINLKSGVNMTSADFIFKALIAGSYYRFLQLWVFSARRRRALFSRIFRRPVGAKTPQRHSDEISNL
jgi:hypothetical protein